MFTLIFEIKNDGLHTKKFDSIGSGNVIPYDELDEIQYKYEILCKGGHLSKSNEFWGELSDHAPKTKVCTHSAHANNANWYFRINK